jgi:hypothetical protein
MHASDIVAACHVLLAPGTVTELRIPHTRYKTVSGYFDNIEKLAAEAAKWSGQAPAVYFTLNPVKPALLARAANRLKSYADQTTADDDVLRRIWLPFDFDPVRPAGVSSTDAEHDAALARARECFAWLPSLGFPQSSLLLADSGNGGHVLARIDLPNDAASTALVKRCIEAVALRFSDDHVMVDQTVYNAARIWKLYGTVAGKGDSIPERPHRAAHTLEGGAA